MVLKIQKWGNSLALRLPKALLQLLGVGCETAVDVQVEDGRIMILPLKKKMDLNEMLSKIDKHNLHAEEWEVKSRGREAI
ncbi:MAG: AbrB/MazE/SpoVT family DNA-binding domain-containing protein [Candidatus Wallbacteria bacterium]|nr:AbrB/MazE/SpoVT family DNA-binding domain-containing protein [Candidatus Wallbacteria bacterium]